MEVGNPSEVPEARPGELEFAQEFLANGVVSRLSEFSLIDEAQDEGLLVALRISIVPVNVTVARAEARGVP